MLSYAGKATPIKAVAQAIPTYIMNYFLLPETICMKWNNSWLTFSEKRDRIQNIFTRKGEILLVSLRRNEG